MAFFHDNDAEQDWVETDAMQTTEDELEDLRIELLALQRIASLDRSETLTLEELEAQVNDSPA